MSLVVGPGDRIGIVGPNGIGKSTLLRVLAGPRRARHGAVTAPVPVGYLPQEPEARSGETLRDYLARRTGVGAAEREMDASRPGSTREPELTRVHEALERYLALGGETSTHARGRCSTTSGSAGRDQRELASLSGGEAARAALAAILLARFDVFLLDEPTNNLDFAGLDRLERFLDGLAAGVVLVSHDRAFLDRTVTRVVEIEAETRRVHEYAGTWSDYEAARERARAQHQAAFADYVDERDRYTASSPRAAYRGTGGRRDGRPPRHERAAREGGAGEAPSRAARRGRQAVEPVAAAAPVRDAAADRLRRRARRRPHRGRLVRPRPGRPAPRLRRPPRDRRAKRLRQDDAYPRADRRAAAHPGRRRIGHRNRLRRAGSGTRPFAGPLLDDFARAAAARDHRGTHVLAKFALGADDVDRDAASLSPGERTRAGLALLAARGVNCLILDEPTNHLDLEAIEELETALTAYEGSLVVVTHDRRFLERLEVTRTLDLG